MTTTSITESITSAVTTLTFVATPASRFLERCGSELMSRVIYCFIQIPPDGQLFFDSEKINTYEDAFAEEEIYWQFKRHETTVVRLVCKSWANEVQRIQDQFGMVDIRPWGSFGRISGPYPRQRRLIVTAPSFDPSKFPKFAAVLRSSPFLVRLHVRLEMAEEHELEVVAEQMTDVVRELLQKRHLRVLRWDGPPLDILSIATSSHLERLILDEVPSYSELPKQLPDLTYLTHLSITLANYFDIGNPPSNIIRILCSIYLPALISFTVTSSLIFPHLEDFLHGKKHQLIELRIRDYYVTDEPYFPLLPPMPKLYVCGIQLHSFIFRLGGGQVPWTMTHLVFYGFSAVSIEDPERSPILASLLYEACVFIAKNRKSLFPNLRKVRLYGLKKVIFDNTELGSYDMGLYNYADALLRHHSISLTSHDGFYIIDRL